MGFFPALTSKFLYWSTVAGTLFEFDERFELLGGFEKYDYNQPEAVKAELRGVFDVLLVDPPFLSEECLEKTAQTVKILMDTEAKLILCTGQYLLAWVFSQKSSQML